MAAYWSCAQTKPHEEALAIRNLRRQRFTAFYPFVLLPNRYHRLAVRPVFPGYVFVELDDKASNWAPINSTLGVRRLLTVAAKDSEYRQPAHIAFVDDLRRLRVRQPGAGGPAEDTLPAGTTVRIKRGPFAEHIALVHMSVADRVHLLLQVFSREIEVAFSAADVEIIRRPTEALYAGAYS